MKFLIGILIISVMIFADVHKVYYYTSADHIGDFKTLKVKFDAYLKRYGAFEFQAFSDKAMFEKFLKKGDSLVMLSSLHYVQIADKYKLEAQYVVVNKKSITDSNVIIGKKGTSLSGVITTAFSKKYTKNLLRKTIGTHRLNILKVPKEIDALMAVGYGMSQFASVSKASFNLLRKTNKVLSKDMHIIRESNIEYRMLVAKSKNSNMQDYSNIFTDMHKSKEGREILKHLGIDNIVKLDKAHLRQLRSLL